MVDCAETAKYMLNDVDVLVTQNEKKNKIPVSRLYSCRLWTYSADNKTVA